MTPPSFSRRPVLAGIAAAAAMIAAPALAAPAIGKPAPAFTAVDSTGKSRALSEFKGKTVVLEWTNDGCPYVQKHYKTDAMQELQKSAAADGVVWLSIISSAPGKQGYKTAAEANTWKTDTGAAPAAILLDPKGEVGRAYAAKTTPHMYIVNPAGTLVYMGGIDDKNSADPATLQGAKNYVVAALADMKAGRAVAQPVSAPYGCSVKY
ncbi:MAG: redoxin domain-containing protein [Phenylobacterium sp.]|uniref:redoxin domain-containing protein n=1 Tax=Phenylobacterium sp. TaxID=1871053 RepID=UPI0027171D1C|nr:redoxin domain-containing protein [Phenylobacterium sp.]MDO8901226.1 redoxin domain-containing protein [Phenylobacterium sp.]